MAEVGALEIASLGLLILIGFYLLYDKLSKMNQGERPLDDDEIERIANLVLSREAARLKEGNTEEMNRMDTQVREVTTENVTIRELVSAVSQAQELTASAAQDMANATQDIGQKSQMIVNALGGDNPIVKRDYGEGRAKHILTMGGLVEGEHFLEQPTLAPYEGNDSGKSPDFVILPAGGGAQALDSKAITKDAFNAFYQLDTEEDATEKKRLLGKHAQAVWNHVCLLAERNYPLGLEQRWGKGPDFTLMFIPNDEFLHRAEIGVSKKLQDSMGADTLDEAAIRRGVHLVSPRGLQTVVNYTMVLWKSAKKLDDVNDILQRIDDLTEAVVDSEEKKKAHHDSLEKAIESWNEYVKWTESTHGGRKKPSLRVAITSLFEKVSSKQIQSGRGNRGLRKEVQPLEELSASFEEPTKTNIMDIHKSARLEVAEVEEEE